MTDPDRPAGSSDPGVAGSSDLDLLEAIVRRRRSVRAFLPRPVPRPLVERLVELALRTPSNCNTQPWFIHVVAGAALARWGERMREAAAAGIPPDHDVPEPFAYRGVYRDRQVDAAVRLFAAQGIGRDDAVGRARSTMRNYGFFGAPQIALFTLPAGSGAREAADVGQCMQTFLLALTAAGLGGCPQGSLGGYAAISHEMLEIPRDRLILAGVSFGYEDTAHETAAVRPGRAGLEALATFHDLQQPEGHLP